MAQSKLITSRRFYPLFWTQFLGAFNDNFLKNALVILITFKVRSLLGIPSAQMVSVAGGIFILPYFLFSATAGQLADKYEKGRIIRIIKTVEIGIMSLAALGFLTGRYELLLLVLFLMGMHSTFFGPVKYSILPQHLGEDELVTGNALIEASTFLAILIGTIAGGVLISIAHQGAWIVSLGLIAVAALGLAAAMGIPEAKAVDAQLKVEWNPVRPTLSILKDTLQNETIYRAVIGISWFWFFGAAMLSLFPPYCKDVLHADQSVVTLFLATFSVGIGLGSILCEKFSRGRLELGLVPMGSIGMTLFSLDLFLRGIPHLTSTVNPITASILLHQAAGFRIIFDLLLLSVFSGFFIVPLLTLIQERSEASHRSRVIAANNILNALFMVASAGAVVFMEKQGLTIPQMFLVLGLMNGAVAIYIYTLVPEFLLRFVMYLLANLLYRLRVTGEDTIPAEGPALLVCNHVSFVDWMIISAGVRRPIRFVMDHHFFRGFLVKRLMSRAKVIPIASARDNPEILEAAFKQISDELKAGEIVCIFPEGRITRDGKLNVFKPGVLRILNDTPVPVIPMALHGLWGSLFSRKGGRAILKMPRRFWSRVELRVGHPVPPAEVRIEELSKTVEALLR